MEIILDSSLKCLKPFRKVIERVFKDKEKQDFIVSVYAIDFKPEIIKQKEIKDVKGERTISIKLALKYEKNKFEAPILINISKDSFSPYVLFENKKKLFGKSIAPPTQFHLSSIEIMQIFKDALLVKERINQNNPTYIELTKFGYNLLLKNKSIDMVLFLMIYCDILNGNDFSLIKGIFEIFSLDKLVRPLKSNDLLMYHEKLQILYNDQIPIFEKIRNMKCNFDLLLKKFYTIYINAYYIVENYITCESILIDLRDNNPFDKLILPKLYLSEYASFYRNIPISNDLQNTLIGNLIYTSTNFNQLLTSFSLISEYIKKDFVTLLMIITNNYDKIYQLCNQSNKCIKINKYITQNSIDDLTKIQYYLDFIVQKKLENNFKSLDFDINMWDIYVSISSNSFFWNYLKSKLIIASLCYNDIVGALTYIIKYTNKSFIEMLDLIVLNYEKIKYICMNEKKEINIADFINQNLDDNIEKIKETFCFIISQKLKDQYEIINFNVKIWKFYVINNYQRDFLDFLEIKLYESAINSKDIYDSIEYSSNLRNKSFILMLEVILQNFDRIIYILKTKSKNINIEKYINQKPGTDDLFKIYELIKEIIEKEKLESYCLLKFNETIWSPYTQCQNIDILKLIRKIILECKIMDSNLNEDNILLSKKIHDIGFNEIKSGTLIDKKLLEFLGEEEAFYVEKQINGCQNQINHNAYEIHELKKENDSLKNKLSMLEQKLANLYSENERLKGRISSNERQISSLKSSLSSLQSDYSRLSSRVSNLY